MKPLSAKMFKADKTLLHTDNVEENNAFYENTPPALLAVYQKYGKTLVLLAAARGPRSLPYVNEACEISGPQIALVEREAGEFLQKWKLLIVRILLPRITFRLCMQTGGCGNMPKGYSYDDFQMLWIIRNVARETRSQTAAAYEIKGHT